jgi:hypothetical protein
MCRGLAGADRRVCRVWPGAAGRQVRHARGRGFVFFLFSSGTLERFVTALFRTRCGRSAVQVLCRVQSWGVFGLLPLRLHGTQLMVRPCSITTL